MTELGSTSLISRGLSDPQSGFTIRISSHPYYDDDDDGDEDDECVRCHILF